LGTGRKISDSQLEEILSDYKNEMPVAEIYNKYKHLASSTTISRAIRASGVTLRSAGPKRSTCIECEEPVYRGKMCSRHYRQKLAEKKGSCNMPDCDQLQEARGCCSKHYQRLMSGRPMEDTIAIWVNANGYICEYRKGHIQANKDGRTLQHRRIMSDKLGRRLESHENVHHINGDKLDNSLENLELWVKTQPAGQRVEDLVVWAEEILERYKHVRQ
jgi:hypothetical protein